MTRDEQINAQEIAGRMVAEHVYYCASGIVSRLQELAPEDEALVELYEPTPQDYQDMLEDHGARIEETEESFVLVESGGERTDLDGDEDDAARAACDILGIDPEVEIYEYWIVSDWLAGKLRAKSEHVGDLYGLTIWGRCATGQAIKLDSSIQDIALAVPRYTEER